MIKVLLVEDDPFIVEIYLKKFEMHGGFEVVSAVSGKQADALLRTQDFDLVLLDMVIPEMSGMDILRNIHEHPEEYRSDIDIVVFSNLSSQEDREAAAKLGAKGFIPKSDFTPTQTIEEVARYAKLFDEQRKNGMMRGSSPSAAAIPDPIQSNGKRILFVEDEEMFVDMFGRRLSQEGYEVVIEKDGKAGLERALSESFNLILTDALLPNASGVEIAEAVRKNPERSKTPIFITTASLDEREIEDIRSRNIVEKIFLKTKTTPTELAYFVNEFFSLSDEKA